MWHLLLVVVISIQLLHPGASPVSATASRKHMLIFLVPAITPFLLVLLFLLMVLLLSWHLQLLLLLLVLGLFSAAAATHASH